MTVHVSVTGDDPRQVEQVKRAVVAVVAATGITFDVEDAPPPPPVSPSTSEPVSVLTGGHPLVGLSTDEVLRLRAFIAKDQGGPLPIGHLTWRAAHKPDEIRLYLSAMREAEAEAKAAEVEEERRAAERRAIGSPPPHLMTIADGSSTVLSGVVDTVNQKTTTRGDRWCSFVLRCPDGAVKVLLFPAAFQMCGTPTSGAAVTVTGRVNRRDGDVEVMVQQWVADRQETTEPTTTPDAADLFPPEWIEDDERSAR